MSYVATLPCFSELSYIDAVSMIFMCLRASFTKSDCAVHANLLGQMLRDLARFLYFKPFTECPEYIAMGRNVFVLEPRVEGKVAQAKDNLGKDVHHRNADHGDAAGTQDTIELLGRRLQIMQVLQHAHAYDRIHSFARKWQSPGVGPGQSRRDHFDVQHLPGIA